MATRISIDVDLTLINENGELLPDAIEGLKALKAKGYLLMLWSYGGEDYARSVAQKHKLEKFFEGYATKPDLVIDDDFGAISQLPTIDVRVAKDWSQIAERTIKLAEDMDNRTSAQDAPHWLKAMWRDRFNVGVQSSIAIWRQRETYFRWPKQARNFSSEFALNWVRHKDGKRKDCYNYPQPLADEITRRGFRVDRHNNGSAIVSFLLAEGERPLRPFPSRWGWTIHHIYDGQHPHFQNEQVPHAKVPHAINDPNLFTDSRGLVAVHPFADYIAMREPLLAWLLRWEASKRFPGFDPMEVFN
jgi:hypothetical protein